MKKVVGLIIAILLMSGMAGIGSWAFFNDMETSSQNILTAGVLDLKTNNAEGVSQTILATNLQPGAAIGPDSITLKNAGSLNGASLGISFSYVENDSSPNPVNMTANQTAAVLDVTTLSYGGTSLLGSITDSNGNGAIDIQDLSAANLTGLSGISAGSSKNFVIGVTANSSMSHDFQADGITITMNFTLNQ